LQKNVPKDRMITGHCLVVRFFACLGGEGKGDSVTFGVSQDNFGLDNGVGGVNQFGNIETSLRYNIFADNLIDFNFLGDTGLDGFSIGQVNSDVKRGINGGDFVSLGLVFLTAVLVFSSIVATITRCAAGSDLHGFRFFIISNLGNTSGESVGLVLVRVGAKLMSVDFGGQRADGEDLFVTVVFIFNNLDGEDNLFLNILESRYANLSVDRGVGIPAVVGGGMDWDSHWDMGNGSILGKSHNGQQSKDKGLHYQ
jgi:hypothetical protein